MATIERELERVQQGEGFDFFRLSKSKALVDISPNTLRKFFKEGLRFYRIGGGRAVYVSRCELRQFIISRSQVPSIAA